MAIKSNFIKEFFYPVGRGFALQWVEKHPKGTRAELVDELRAMAPTCLSHQAVKAVVERIVMHAYIVTRSEEAT